MPDLNLFIEKINTFISKLPFSLSVVLIVSSFALIFFIALGACFASPAVRAVDKRPFFYYLNLYTALLFAIVAAHTSLSSAVVPTALFWIVGYLLYGILCMVTKKREKLPEVSYVVAPAAVPAQPKPPVRPAVPAAKTNVRLEHAMGITDKLLAREIGRSDRQELEKIKSSLSFLQSKGNLTAQDSDILNDSFNTLLKLMARYGE